MHSKFLWIIIIIMDVMIWEKLYITLYEKENLL